MAGSFAHVEPHAVLRVATSPAWVAHALADLDAILVDHAHCEKKAAVMALSMVNRYGEHPELIEAMLALAKQELDHLTRVWEILRARGVALGHDPGDPYVQALRAQVRKGDPQHLLDVLLVNALVEARSCERFLLLRDAVEPGELRDFYAELVVCEGGHFRLFAGLAEEFFGPAETRSRLDTLLDAEAAVVRGLDSSPTMHG